MWLQNGQNTQKGTQEYAKRRKKTEKEGRTEGNLLKWCKIITNKKGEALHTAFVPVHENTGTHHVSK